MNWPARFFEPSTAFDVPMVGWTTGVLVGALAIASILVREAPYVLVANHTSHLDTLALGAAVPGRLRHRLFPLAAGDTFFSTPGTAFLSSLLMNALPMWRRNVGRHGLSQMRERLVSRHDVFVLFPEGTRSRDGELGKFKAGIGMMVAGTEVPVYPCHLEGAFEAWPPGDKRPGKGRLTLRIGEPLRFHELSNDRAGWNEASARLKAAILDLEPSST
jgi:1-acyl-sn-glycerol-3-phosphate acyltransferase